MQQGQSKRNIHESQTNNSNGNTKSTLGNFYMADNAINNWKTTQEKISNLIEIDKIEIDLNNQMIPFNSIIGNVSDFGNMNTIDALTSEMNDKVDSNVMEYPGQMINSLNQQPYFVSNNIPALNVYPYNNLEQNQRRDEIDFEELIKQNTLASVNKGDIIAMNNQTLNGLNSYSMERDGRESERRKRDNNFVQRTKRERSATSSRSPKEFLPSVKPSTFTEQVFTCGTTWTREYDLNGKNYLSKMFDTEQEYKVYIHSFNAKNEDLGPGKFMWVMERGRKLSTAKSRSTQRIVFKDCFNCFYGRNYFKIMKKMPKHVHTPLLDPDGKRILCPANLIALGLPNGQVRLKYFDNHIGHINTVKDDNSTSNDISTNSLSDSKVKSEAKTIDSIPLKLDKCETEKRKLSETNKLSQQVEKVKEEEIQSTPAKRRKKETDENNPSPITQISKIRALPEKIHEETDIPKNPKSLYEMIFTNEKLQILKYELPQQKSFASSPILNGMLCYVLKGGKLLRLPKLGQSKLYNCETGKIITIEDVEADEYTDQNEGDTDIELLLISIR